MYRIFFVFVTFLMAPYLSAQENIITEIKDLYPEEIKLSGFSLGSESEISIDGAVIEGDRFFNDRFVTNAWILDADSREVVWEIRQAEVDDYKRDLVYYKDKINLAAGNYEVYYSTYLHNSFGFYGPFHEFHHDGFFSGIFSWLFDEDKHHEYYYHDSDDYQYYEDLHDDIYLKIKGNGAQLNHSDIHANQQMIKNAAFLSFTELRNDIYEKQNMKVNNPVKLKIYALGEADFDGDYDFAKIIDLKTRETVWKLTYHNTERAGGARKNRIFDEEITLDPGLYQILYVTDDSHSFKRWNMQPPYDPAFWGITISLVHDSEKSYITKTGDQIPGYKKLIDLTAMRDSQFDRKGFILKKPLDLHIYALGEGDDGDMYDYGWISNAETQEKVWKMRYFDTEHAGGDEKNRLFDQIVHFEPGKYLVYYVTDGSHSAYDWNASPPYDQGNWGITVAVLDENFEQGDVAAYNPEEDQSVLASLVRVGDSERRRVRFTLDRDSKVRIYALGEGVDYEMYDYAWIEDAESGRIIWEMTYRMTDRAGGTRKNRLYDGTISMSAGAYLLHYRSDDSHSFSDWNDRPPHDPFNWGVTLYLQE